MRRYVNSRVFLVIALIAIALQASLLYLALFEPALDYQITKTPQAPLDSEQFLRTLQVLADAQVYRNTKVEVLTNGQVFYPAELSAIRSARYSVNLEAYIFQKGEVTEKFVQALTERARAGVRVNVVADAIGSLTTPKNYFKPLTDAGGHVEWYHPIRWYTWPRLNNRTHRELIIVDGQIGFIGGAGFADHWLKGDGKQPVWRDTMFRLEGEAVAGLQAAFVENWVEASGQILTGREYFPFEPAGGKALAMVINSSPSAGRSTRARMVFQTLLASARKRIYITTPYFLPDRSVRDELVRAIQARGVEVKVITPGKRADHLLTRRSSRRLYGELLQAGVQIYEYQPAMIHTKALIVDSVWSVVGSTNFDNRSFGLNDEVNLAAFDAALGQRIEQDFARDIAQSRGISFQEWSRRPFWERFHEWFGALLERQQ